MVHEAIEIASHDNQQQQQQQQVTEQQQDQQQQQQRQQNAENFSWTFFEEVSSVDNQLRCEDESSIITVTSNNDDANDGHHVIINGHREEEKTSRPTNNNNNNDNNNSALMTTARAITHDLSALNIRVNDQRLHQTHPPHLQHEDSRPHNETITGKCNGLVNTAIVHADILSQHSPDLILPQTQTTAPFQFTSPTSTFKRKKQLQQQLQQQQHVNSLKRNQLQEGQQTFDQEQQQQQQHPVQQHRRHPSTALSFGNAIRPQHHQQLLYNETTVMISGAGSIINPDTGIGSNAKTRTLPAISTQTGRHAVDLVSSATSKTKKKHGKRIQTQTETSVGEGHTGKGSCGKMGSKLTTGQNGTHSRTSTSSNNNRDEASLKKAATNHQRRVSASQTHSHSFIDGIETHLGLIGWRKKCLYTVLLLLMLLIITNLVLTLWILKVMEFSPEGMGQLKIVPGGIQLTGQALIMDMLRASTIRSRHGQSIAIESSRNFSINTRDANGKLENHLFLGHDKLECLATGFRINDTAGRNLFSVNRNEVTIGAHALRIEGEGGAIFRESIQTPHVRAEPGRELRFESPTRQIELTAARDINLQSRAGGIELSALEDIKLSALDGSIRLESSKILMPNLRTAQPPLPGAAQSRDHLHRVFQLCACANGKLFLAAPHSICAGDDSTVCR